MNTIVEEGCR